MIIYLLLALVNGILIGLCRALNGRLSQSKGPFIASFYNHIIGTLILTLLLGALITLSIWAEFQVSLPTSLAWAEIPWFAYFGGVIGALYVAINSHILTRIGALKAALLVISGQMLTSVAFELFELSHSASITSTLTQALPQACGVALIILGVYSSNRSWHEQQN